MYVCIGTTYLVHKVTTHHTSIVGLLTNKFTASRITLGNSKPKFFDTVSVCLTISILTVLNNFMKRPSTGKSSDLRSDLFMGHYNCIVYNLMFVLFELLLPVNKAAHC